MDLIYSGTGAELDEVPRPVTLVGFVPIPVNELEETKDGRMWITIDSEDMIRRFYRAAFRIVTRKPVSSDWVYHIHLTLIPSSSTFIPTLAKFIRIALSFIWWPDFASLSGDE